MTPSTRRSFLGTLGAGTLVGLAGCSALESESESGSPVTIEIGGQIDQELTAELEVVSAAAEDDLSENMLYRATFDIGPDGVEEAFTEVEDAFDAQPAIVRVLFGGVGVTAEYTFVPDCQDEAELDDVLYVSIKDPYTVTFRQNRCR
jgi:hypothetical protein